MAHTRAGQAAGVHVTRSELSIGSLDLFRFDRYDHAFPRHSHERFTLGVFGAGNGSISFRSGTWRAREGAILAIAPDQAHSADPLRGRGWTYRTLYPSNELVGRALDSDSSSFAGFASPVIDDRALARELESLHARLEQSSPTLATEERLLALIRRLVRRYGSHREHDEAHAGSSAVARAREYLEENFSKNVKLDELSRVSGVTPFHLIRSFRDRVGIPPHAYLTQVRASRAREMLIAGVSVSAVAYRCGFSDQSHLTRTFKRIFGITPGAYVKAV